MQLQGIIVKKIDVFMWIINITCYIPSLLVNAINLAVGKGYWLVLIAVCLTILVGVARVERSLVLTTKNLEYLEVARALGYSNFRIILRHILAPIIVISAANFAVAILMERDLRFLCIGTKHPTTY